MNPDQSPDLYAATTGDCPICRGDGYETIPDPFTKDDEEGYIQEPCPGCGGTGKPLAEILATPLWRTP